MAKQNVLVDLDLNGNQLLNSVLQNLATAPATTNLKPGWLYWNTTTKTAMIYTGLAAPNEWKDLGDLYTHPTHTARNPTLSGNNVLATLTVDTNGHVTGATTRQMTLAELGFTGDADANKYTHPTFAGNGLAGAPLSGAVVISNVTVNAEGHVTGFATRSLTAANIGAAATSHTHTLSNITDVTSTAAELNLLDLAGLTVGWVLRATGPTTAAWGALLASQITNDKNWVSINDGSSTSTTEAWSAKKISDELAAINTTITGGLVNKGGYDAATNTPKLGATPMAGIKNGWTYVVTVAGTFLGEAVQIGDMIIAKQDSPTTLAHWTIVNKNIPDIVQASAGAQGIIQLASQAEVLAGTDPNKAITPATLQGNAASTTNKGVVNLATDAETQTGSDATKAVTPASLNSRTATATRTGLAALATQAEVLAGVDGSKIVTAATLQGNVASTTNRGVTQLATQAEVDAGAVTDKTVTPQTLKATLDARVGGYAATFGNGALQTFDVTHGLNTVAVTVEIIEVASGETVIMQVRRTSATVVNIQCNNVPTTNQYMVIIKK